MSKFHEPKVWSPMSPARKAARISPESRPIAFTAVGVAALIYAGAFTTSFFGQAALAAHMAIPSALQYVVPIVIDLGLVLFTLGTLLKKTRGESTVWTNCATAFWTTVSIAANILHVLVPAGPAGSWDFGTYTGAALSALMPLGALGASLVLENLLIEPTRSTSAAPTASAFKESATEATATPKAPSPAPEGPAAHPAFFAEAERPAGALAKAPPLPARHTPTRTQAARTAAVPKPPSKTDAEKAEERRQVLAHKAAGLSNPAIADKVGKSESTVKRILAEAKAAAVETVTQDSETRAA